MGWRHRGRLLPHKLFFSIFHFLADLRVFSSEYEYNTKFSVNSVHISSLLDVMLCNGICVISIPSYNDMLFSLAVVVVIIISFLRRQAGSRAFTKDKILVCVIPNITCCCL